MCSHVLNYGPFIYLQPFLKIQKAYPLKVLPRQRLGKVQFSIVEGKGTVYWLEIQIQIQKDRISRINGP